MTDKEIIIDGVDVSECDKFDNISELCSIRQPFEEIYHSCNEYENCYFKQLQRKTAECEELKAQLETYLNMLDSSEFRIALTDVRTGERKVWRKLGNKAQRDKQALDEIEKYFLKQCEIHKSSIGDYAVQNMCEQCEIKKNLDIISKAKDGKNG